MKHCIFLCTRQWQIQKLLHESGDFELHEDETLTDLICEPRPLLDGDAFESRQNNFLLLHLIDQKKETPFIIVTYPKHFLVFAVAVTNGEEFLEFARFYVRYVSWAEENLRDTYDDGYLQIQQMNNQLLNFQRALMKSNHQLNQTLNEIRDANNTISLLERDRLTGLYRASAFYRKAEYCLRNSPGKIFDIIALNVERFALINEIFGRKAGDKLLKNLALFLTGRKDADRGLLAHAFADTFYIMIPQSVQFHETLRQELPVFLHSYPLPMHIHVKLGVYRIAESILVEQMCDRAFLAIGNTVTQSDDVRIYFYDHSIHEKLLYNHQILDSIPDALKNREFKLYLQPKVDMRTETVIGAEALIRWIHPKLGFIPPDSFIPLLENEGDIYHVDQYIWEEACRFLKMRKDQGLRCFPVSINIARADLYEDDLADVLTNLLQKYDLEPAELHLEIIERAYVNDSTTIFPVLTKLRSLGFVIEMDDFGTGESSLAMLAEMPIDVIKLDRHFLITAAGSKRQAEIVRFIVNLADTLGLSIIAEGVETHDDEKLLVSMGCYFAQGYLYGKPMLVDDSPLQNIQ